MKTPRRAGKQREHLRATLQALADRIAAEPEKAAAKAKENLQHVGDPQSHAHVMAVFQAHWLALSCGDFARELRLIIAGLIVLLASFGCVSDEPEPPPPTCEEIGAPDTLLCNRGGLCSWEGEACCIRHECPAGDDRCAVDERCAP